MIDSNETIAYENGRDAGYDNGYEDALEDVVTLIFNKGLEQGVYKLKSNEDYKKQINIMIEKLKEDIEKMNTRGMYS